MLILAKAIAFLLYLRLAIVLFPAVSAATQNASSFNPSGVHAFERKDLLGQAEPARPEISDALLDRAKAFLELRQFKEADEALQSYVRAHPSSAEAWFLLGYALFSENRPQESLQAYTKGAAFQKPQAEDLKIVGLDYVLLDNYDDAAKWLNKAVEFNPRDVDAWYSLGRVRFTQNHFAEARAAFKRVLDLDPHNVKAESNIGLLYEAEDRPDAALDAYRKAIQWQASAPHHNEQPFLNLGALMLARGRYAEAVKALEEAAAIAALNPSAHGQLGRAYLQINQTSKAQEELETAARLDPDNANWHYQLGRVYRRMGQVERAKVQFAISERLMAGKLPR